VEERYQIRWNSRESRISQFLGEPGDNRPNAAVSAER